MESVQLSAICSPNESKPNRVWPNEPFEQHERHMCDKRDLNGDFEHEMRPETPSKLNKRDDLCKEWKKDTEWCQDQRVPSCSPGYRSTDETPNDRISFDEMVEPIDSQIHTSRQPAHLRAHERLAQEGNHGEKGHTQMMSKTRPTSIHSTLHMASDAERRTDEQDAAQGHPQRAVHGK